MPICKLFGPILRLSDKKMKHITSKIKTVLDTISVSGLFIDLNKTYQDGHSSCHEAVGAKHSMGEVMRLALK